MLLEHDNRFAVFPEFIYYDYAHPLKLPGTYHAITTAPLPFLLLPSTPVILLPASNQTNTHFLT